MFRKLKWAVVAASILVGQVSLAQASSTEVESLKQQIFELAKSYQGQGDPDQSKQKSIEPLVEKLIRLSPMPPIKDRIAILEGAWKQVWGPYDYRNDAGGVDPKIGVAEIYQVVFADGYYYNVSPYYPKGDRSQEQIALLRGEFKLDSKDPNGLKVKFTKYPGVDVRPTNMEIWELAAIAEAGKLENEITIVPTWIVKLFFGGGKLEEVYTDEDMRILFGTSARPEARRSLYVMVRVN
jgi:hypothetical protein